MSPKQTLPSEAHPEVWTPERRELALNYAHTWRGTPHVDRIAIRGVGIDCVNFVCGALMTCGVCQAFTLPYYDPAWGIGRRNNVLERVAVQCLFSRIIQDTEPLEFGDIGIFRVGRQSNHVGIVLNDEMWHVSLGRMVEPEPITRRLQERLQSVIRVQAVGLSRHPETLTQEELAHE